MPLPGDDRNNSRRMSEAACEARANGATSSVRRGIRPGITASYSRMVLLDSMSMRLLAVQLLSGAAFTLLAQHTPYVCAATTKEYVVGAKLPRSGVFRK